MENENTIIPEASGTPPADPISSLLADPTLIARMRALLQNTQTDAPQSTDTPSSPKTETPPQNPLSSLLGSNGADGLSAILSNPALMEKLPQIMAMLKPMLVASAPSAPTHATVAPAEAEKRKPSVSDERDKLLLALKPFLSHERQEAVDAILRIAKLGILLKQIT